MDSNKYYFINIQIPLEILPSKENKLLSDRIDITFSECQTLPPIKDNHTTFVSDKIKEFIDNFSQTLSPQPNPTHESPSSQEPSQIQKEPEEEPPTLYVTKSQPKYPKNPNANISFKHRKDKKTREFTKKNYEYST